MVKFCLILEITSKLINRFPTAVMCELLGTRCEAVIVNYRCRRADVTFPTDGHDTIWSCGYCTKVMNSCVVVAQQVFKLGSSNWIFTFCCFHWPHLQCLTQKPLRPLLYRIRTPIQLKQKFIYSNYLQSVSCQIGIFHGRVDPNEGPMSFLQLVSSSAKTIVWEEHATSIFMLEHNNEDGVNWCFRGMCFFYQQNQ